jgi:multisubunit Na+/H+ antiporter MnhG subunit
MPALTKIEVYHIIIGLVSTIIWMFGSKASLPPEAISFAQTVTTGVVAHAIGMQAGNSTPDTSVQTEAPAQNIQPPTT